ncbi:katanin p60 ATPase-containing subunit A-like 1 isoform X1, partial [Brachionus plicatilis]
EVTLDEDVNLKEIAEKLDGYSEADITTVCRDSSMIGMRRKIEIMTIEDIQKLSKDELNIPAKMVDFLDVLKRVSPSVCRADLEKYNQAMMGSVMYYSSNDSYETPERDPDVWPPPPPMNKNQYR